MRDFEGVFTRLIYEGTIIGVQVELADGKVRTFWGDHRPMATTFEGREQGARVLIHYQDEWDWTIEFPDEEK